MKFSFLAIICIFLGCSFVHGMEISEQEFNKYAAQLVINRLLLYQLSLIENNQEIPSCKPSKEDMNKLSGFLDKK